MNGRVLLVDDDRFLLENVSRLLRNSGYEVKTAGDASAAIQAVSEFAPDMAILDVSLPDKDGLALCHEIRGNHRFPILMLTARSEAADRIRGLESGADDYLVKPFDPGELLARVKAQLRRSLEYANSNLIQIGSLTVDTNGREAAIDGRKIELTNREFALLAHLASNRGKLLSREELFSHSWGFDISFGSNSLDVYIYRLRKKLEGAAESPRYLHTVKGYGYKIEDQGAA